MNTTDSHRSPVPEEPHDPRTDHSAARASRRQEAPETSPALQPVRWSGRKTAVAAALAIGLAAGTGVAATAVVPTSESSGRQEMHGGSMGAPGQGGQGRGGPGQQGGTGQQGPSQPQPGSQDPAGSGAGSDSA